MSRVLVDTSVWVEHFRQSSPQLLTLLLADGVLVHPLVIGEIACGSPPQRAQTLRDLSALALVTQASVNEAILLIEKERMFGLGCGLVDVMLLASTLMTPGAELWTLDKRLATLARRLGVLYRPTAH